MEYKLFDEYITLQALLKELSIIHSGGAIKGFLANNVVLFNGEEEKRRGKKLRYGDVITIPSEELEITIVVPTQSEIEKHKKEVVQILRGNQNPAAVAASEYWRYAAFPGQRTKQCAGRPISAFHGTDRDVPGRPDWHYHK